MSFDLERIYNLLPAIHRIRDEEQGKPLRALLSVIADQTAVLEEDLAQLYDDQFVETAASWALPYIGDLLGVRGLQGVGAGTFAPRAEVGNTIAYRRRKGTIAVIEALAHDLTGLPARAVEFFQLLATTQYMNHIRPQNRSVICVRNARRLEFLGTPFEHLSGLEYPVKGEPWIEYPGTSRARLKRFDDLPHTADVRRITPGRGRYNIPNIGIFLWRLRAYPLTLSPAVPATATGRRRFFFSPLGCNARLFNLPATEDDFTHLAEPVNVPIEITRRMMAAVFEDFYGDGRAVQVSVGYHPDGTPNVLPASAFQVCDLSDVVHASGPVPWAHTPAHGKIAIDPVLGRIAFPNPQHKPVLASWHYGFSMGIGGGEYDRTASMATDAAHQETRIDHPATDPPQPIAPVIASLNAFAIAATPGGTITIDNSGRYAGAGAFTIDAKSSRLQLRAGERHRPTIVLHGGLTITGNVNGEVTLDGLLIAGGGLKVTGSLSLLRLRHCTLVPGISLTAHGEPQHPGTPSLIVNSAGTAIEIENCILGGMRVAPDCRVRITNSIIDATAENGIAYGGLHPASPEGAFGGALSIEKSTVIGRVYADAIDLASNTIFLASLNGPGPAAAPFWKGPVQARRLQEGCVRFSYVPAGSRTPRRYYCQPVTESDEALVRPIHSSLRYADARYCQLSMRCPAEIRTGADDESEMGAFHDCFLPLRESYLRSRLDEYLRFGLEAGIFYAT